MSDHDDVEEWLDIVDADDRVIGRDTRTEVHRQQHMHRACHILLRNSVGEIFVQLRSRTKDANPGLWDTSAAGHVDAGEGYVDCAVRELDEELGIRLEASALEWRGRLMPSIDNGFEHVAVFRACSDQSLTLQADEIDDGRWLTASALDTWMASEPALFTPILHVIWPFDRRDQWIDGYALPLQQH